MSNDRRQLVLLQVEGHLAVTGATAGVAGDSPGTCSCMSAGWQHGGLETWSIGGGTQGKILTMCAIALPQHCWEVVAVQFHHIAMEDAGNWVGWGGVALNNGPGKAGLVIAG
jgi:hypothetical protein